MTITIDEIPLFSRFTIFRLHFGLGGLDMHQIRFLKLRDAVSTGLTVDMAEK